MFHARHFGADSTRYARATLPAVIGQAHSTPGFQPATVAGATGRS